MTPLAEALNKFKEATGRLPFAIYCDPITAANTDFSDLSVWGIPVKVSTYCPIGNYYMVNEKEAQQIEEWGNSHENIH